jgi:acetoin utilization deacetylase AcuC-like enzyme
MSINTSTGIVWSDRYVEHDTGPCHPERSSRLSGIEDKLARAGAFSTTLHIEPVPVDLEAVYRVHEPDYVKRLHQRSENGLPYIDSVECPLCPVTYQIALLAVGGTIRACDEVMAGRIESAFCAVRPPGHHAEAAKAYGFCYLNNIAIAAEYLRHAYGLKRVAILDWDVHHGNGTQHHFEADPDVLFISLHQDPRTLFPGTGFEDEVGVGPGTGATMNFPMMPGSGDEDYFRAFEQQILPRMSEFAPEFLLISAGFDAHADDPLANMGLSTEAFEWMTVQCVRLMHELGRPRIVSVLEGGYNIDALGDCILAHLQGYGSPVLSVPSARQ